MTEIIPKGPPGEFSVCQFFLDGKYEYVRKFVAVEEAILTFKFYTTNVTARVGITKRVILTDGDDCINMEWKYGEGITFPPELKGRDNVNSES